MIQLGPLTEKNIEPIQESRKNDKKKHLRLCMYNYMYLIVITLVVLKSNLISFKVWFKKNTT